MGLSYRRRPRVEGTSLVRVRHSGVPRVLFETCPTDWKSVRAFSRTGFVSCRSFYCLWSDVPPEVQRGVRRDSVSSIVYTVKVPIDVGIYCERLSLPLYT